MGAGSLDRGLLLDQPQKIHQFLSLLSNGPDLAKMNRGPGRAFDRKHTDIFETGLTDLLCEILRTVKVGGCEVGGVVGRISMLAGRKIGGDDIPEDWIFEISSQESVAQRSKAGNRSRENDTSRLKDTIRFAQRITSISTLHEVIERAK